MKYAILLARQRSGTGALGSVLDKHPELKYLGEVFHPDNLGQEHNFFTFLLKKVKTEPEAALRDNGYDVFLGFLEHLSERYSGQTLIVDIKYRSLHHLDGGWRGLEERPRAITEAVSRRVPVLHLTRRNALRSFLSGRLAEANKVWHARKDQDLSVTSTVLNIRRLSDYIVTSETEASLINRWIRNVPDKEIFDYDEMFDAEGLIETGLAERLATLLGVGPFGNRSPGFVKQAPTDLEAAIENYPLVKRALLGSGAKWMLDD